MGEKSESKKPSCILLQHKSPHPLCILPDPQSSQATHLQPGHPAAWGCCGQNCVVSMHWPQQPGSTNGHKSQGLQFPFHSTTEGAASPDSSGIHRGCWCAFLCHPVLLAAPPGLLPLLLLCPLPTHCLFCHSLLPASLKLTLLMPGTDRAAAFRYTAWRWPPLLPHSSPCSSTCSPLSLHSVPRM